mmetsp:Transcript_14054/g.41939  ORF Transcript_14054/g.41939 Transcript_14054/m.41939 type:complete len:201 (+) Transcript_14054:6022-6624(+)
MEPVGRSVHSRGCHGVGTVHDEAARPGVQQHVRGADVDGAHLGVPTQVYMVHRGGPPDEPDAVLLADARERVDDLGRLFHGPRVVLRLEPRPGVEDDDVGHRIVAPILGVPALRVISRVGHDAGKVLPQDLRRVALRVRTQAEAGDVLAEHHAHAARIAARDGVIAVRLVPHEHAVVVAERCESIDVSAAVAELADLVIP